MGLGTHFMQASWFTDFSGGRGAKKYLILCWVGHELAMPDRRRLLICTMFWPRESDIVKMVHYCPTLTVKMKWFLTLLIFGLCLAGVMIAQTQYQSTIRFCILSDRSYRCSWFKTAFSSSRAYHDSFPYGAGYLNVPSSVAKWDVCQPIPLLKRKTEQTSI